MLLFVYYFVKFSELTYNFLSQNAYHLGVTPLWSFKFSELVLKRMCDNFKSIETGITWQGGKSRCFLGKGQLFFPNCMLFSSALEFYRSGSWSLHFSSMWAGCFSKVFSYHRPLTIPFKSSFIDAFIVYLTERGKTSYWGDCWLFHLEVSGCCLGLLQPSLFLSNSVSCLPSSRRWSVRIGLER